MSCCVHDASRWMDSHGNVISRRVSELWPAYLPVSAPSHHGSLRAWAIFTGRSPPTVLHLYLLLLYMCSVHRHKLNWAVVLFCHHFAPAGLWLHIGENLLCYISVCFCCEDDGEETHAFVRQLMVRVWWHEESRGWGVLVVKRTWDDLVSSPLHNIVIQLTDKERQEVGRCRL